MSADADSESLTVLEFPEVASALGADILYLLRGTDVDRDRRITVAALREFCTSQGVSLLSIVTTSSDTTIEAALGSGTRNVVILVTGTAATLAHLHVTGSVPAGCTVTVANASSATFNVTSDATIVGTGESLAPGDWANLIRGSGTNWYVQVIQSKKNCTDITDAIPLQSTTLTKALGKLHLDVFSMPAYSVEGSGSSSVASTLATNLDATTCEIVDALVVAGGTWAAGHTRYDEAGWQKSCLRTRLNEHYIRAPNGIWNPKGSYTWPLQDLDSSVTQIFRGAWVAGFNYAVGDVVQTVNDLTGVTNRWVCKTAHTSPTDHPPEVDSSWWVPQATTRIARERVGEWSSARAYFVGDLIRTSWHGWVDFFLATIDHVAGGTAPSRDQSVAGWQWVDSIQMVSESELRMLVSAGKFQFRHRLYESASFTSVYTDSLIYVTWREL